MFSHCGEADMAAAAEDDKEGIAADKEPQQAAVRSLGLTRGLGLDTVAVAGSEAGGVSCLTPQRHTEVERYARPPTKAPATREHEALLLWHWRNPETDGGQGSWMWDPEDAEAGPPVMLKILGPALDVLGPAAQGSLEVSVVLTCAGAVVLGGMEEGGEVLESHKAAVVSELVERRKQIKTQAGSPEL